MNTKDELYKGFENIPTRKGRGGNYSYVKWQDVADRMNQVFGTFWSSNVEYQDVVGENVIVRVRVTVIDPTDSRVLGWQEGFGGAPNDDRIEAGNAFKSAYSKALKDACKKWGVGLYLDEEGEGPSYGTEPSHSQTKQPSSPPPGFTGHETAPAPSPPAPEPSSKPKATGGLPLPPGVAMDSAPAKNNTPPTPSAPPTPPIPPPAAPSVQRQEPALPQDLPMSKTQPIVTPGGGEGMISDVQKAALQSILSMSGAEYEDLAREAFEFNGLDGKNVPQVDSLTYSQAVHVVKYGNDKFRNR